MRKLNIKAPLDLVETLVQDEGMRKTPYRCTSKKQTIGVGTNLEDNPPSAEALAKVGYKGDRHDVAALVDFFKKNPISEKTAHEWLAADLEKFIEATRRLFPNFDNLTARRQNALVNMCYNMGETRLSKFKNMRHHVNSEDWPMVAIEALDSEWHRRDVKARAVRVAKQFILEGS